MDKRGGWARQKRPWEGGRRMMTRGRRKWDATTRNTVEWKSS